MYISLTSLFIITYLPINSKFPDEWTNELLKEAFRKRGMIFRLLRYETKIKSAEMTRALVEAAKNIKIVAANKNNKTIYIGLVIRE
jgi:hypothetical protein